ncbi:hypothetical protein TrVE_jg2375 [Triparma verrucosa]|uniref:Uncharacterized protein n=1 Tax=Triparma verrucosa TaxID=1606542 RepID=A0A9W7BJU7_9STRA|nr:hypothetical protein TrVE_jg2375 [Triparma verrucosa]
MLKFFTKKKTSPPAPPPPPPPAVDAPPAVVDSSIDSPIDSATLARRTRRYLLSKKYVKIWLNNSGLVSSLEASRPTSRPTSRPYAKALKVTTKTPITRDEYKLRSYLKLLHQHAQKSNKNRHKQLVASNSHASRLLSDGFTKLFNHKISKKHSRINSQRLRNLADRHHYEHSCRLFLSKLHHLKQASLHQKKITAIAVGYATYTSKRLNFSRLHLQTESSIYQKTCLSAAADYLHVQRLSRGLRLLRSNVSSVRISRRLLDTSEQPQPSSSITPPPSTYSSNSVASTPA